ncbi:hypothetical protein F0L74_05040 [Chitinophaga agrisoli]|uniref:Uncharacterized protein n=1 Tax=Chitinophaga agrisoli TaxID=2607653 RepID=A0A5B2W3Q9_9BACT|nr:hypothetical protein [Chitinophaga agrisoli]KAA2245330.1 hypothetical protein F0L74_05040 [Chitinophaga agrisoli]
MSERFDNVMNSYDQAVSFNEKTWPCVGLKANRKWKGTTETKKISDTILPNSPHCNLKRTLTEPKAKEKRRKDLGKSR